MVKIPFFPCFKRPFKGIFARKKAPEKSDAF